MSTIIREAHAQDFEKKKKPELGAVIDESRDDDSDDSYGEDQDEDCGSNSMEESAAPFLRGEGKSRSTNATAGDGGSGSGRATRMEGERQSEREIEEARDDVEAGKGGPSRLG